MFRILASALFIILLPLTALAQAQAPTVWWGVEAHPLWAKSVLDLRGDQVRLQASRMLAEFTVGMVSPGQFRAKYTLVTGFANTDAVSPSGALQVGATDFGPKKGDQPVAPTAKPVNIDWQADVGHRFEVVGFSRFPIRPAAIAELHSSTLTGSSVGATGGSPTQDSETFRRWLFGLGAEAIYSTPYERARAIVVASDRYLFTELSYFQRLVPWAAVGGGYRHEVKRLEGVAIRVSAGFLGAEVAF